MNGQLTLRFYLLFLHERSDDKLSNVDSQEQLNPSFERSSAVHCGVNSMCLCVCAYLAVNQREMLALVHYYLHSRNVDDTQKMRFRCASLLACRAARSGLALPDTEEAEREEWQPLYVCCLFL